MIYIALFSLLPLVLIGLPRALTRHWSFFFNETSVPILKFSERFINRAKNFLFVLGNFSQEEEEQNHLKREVTRLRFERDQFKNVSLENERLVNLLHFIQESSSVLLSTRVVGRAPSRWNESVWIDLGAKDGLEPGMAVLSYEGVAGKIVEVMPKWSRVLLLIDENSKVGAVVERTREIGILEGRGLSCVLKFLPREAQVKPGDRVVTSGLSRFFPPGLEIGRVVKVQDDAEGLFQYAEVSPEVHFGKLEEVSVVMTKERGIKELES